MTVNEVTALGACISAWNHRTPYYVNIDIMHGLCEKGYVVEGAYIDTKKPSFIPLPAGKSAHKKAVSGGLSPGERFKLTKHADLLAELFSAGMTTKMVHRKTGFATATLMVYRPDGLVCACGKPSPHYGICRSFMVHVRPVTMVGEDGIKVNDLGDEEIMRIAREKLKGRLERDLLDETCQDIMLDIYEQRSLGGTVILDVAKHARQAKAFLYARSPKYTSLDQPAEWLR